MDPPKIEPPRETLETAERVKRILYVCMAVFVLLPPILAWWTGALRFE